jgi:hypothetical protein
MAAGVGSTVAPMFHNWPDSAKRRMSRHKRKCRLSRAELNARLRELHSVRHRMLDVAMVRNLTPGELRLVKHILREIDWYEMHEAEPGFRAMDEQRRQLLELTRRVKKLLRCAL